MKRAITIIPCVIMICAIFVYSTYVEAGIISREIREFGEILSRQTGKLFSSAGRHAAGLSEELATHYGDDVVPFLEKTGPAGKEILEESGKHADEIISFVNRGGKDALWIVKDPGRRKIFLRFGQDAADAMLKHPGLASEMIESYGKDMVGALNSLSRRGAQKLALAAEEGVLSVTPRSREILKVIREYGDEAMDFIWKNKGALTVSAVLISFLNSPETYISSASELLVEPVVEPAVSSINWNFMGAFIIIVLSLPMLAKSAVRMVRELKYEKDEK